MSLVALGVLTAIACDAKRAELPKPSKSAIVEPDVMDMLGGDGRYRLVVAPPGANQEKPQIFLVDGRRGLVWEYYAGKSLPASPGQPLKTEVPSLFIVVPRLDKNLASLGGLGEYSPRTPLREFETVPVTPKAN